MTLAQIYWCKKVTQILTQADFVDKRKLLEELKRKTEKTLANVAGLAQNQEIWVGSLANYKMKLIGSILVNEVHHRDVIDMLIQNQVESVDDFEWNKQLR